MENNWQSKNLETLEKDIWGEPEYASSLVKTCHRLREKPINEFDIEDLRIMIGQNIGLKYLIPVALEILEDNILAEGDLFEGDLFKSIITGEINFWVNHLNLFEKLNNLVENQRNLLMKNEPKLYNAFFVFKAKIED